MNILTNPLANGQPETQVVNSLDPSKKIKRFSMSTETLVDISIEDSLEALSHSIITLEKPRKFSLSHINTSPLSNMQKVITNSNKNAKKIQSNTYEKNDTEEFFVTTKMIQAWNRQIGNINRYDIAFRKIKFMRQLAGLEPSNFRVDIPQARLGLCMLSDIEFDSKLKMYALESLLTVLKKDDISKENATSLIILATNLMNLISRERIQSVDLETGIKFTEIYQVLAEVLCLHASNKHFNGITEELKQNLIKAANNIAELNRLNNVKIRFNMSCAKQWLRMLKSDAQELFILTKKMYNLILMGAALYLNDAEEGFERFEKVLQLNDPHLPKFSWHWHNSLSLLKSLARDVKAIKVDENINTNISMEKMKITLNPTILITSSEDTKNEKIKENLKLKLITTLDSNDKARKPNCSSQILALLTLIGQKYKSLSWKFSYGAIETLFDLALNGQTPEIRMQAFKGIEFGENSNNNKKTKGTVILPGLAHFADCKNLGKTLNIKKNIVHLERPKIISQDEIIRECCVEHLIELIKNSNDEAIKRKAKHLLIERALLENYAPLRTRIEDYLITNKIEYSPRKKEKKLLLRTSY